jgi:hypothetical protein
MKNILSGILNESNRFSIQDLSILGKRELQISFNVDGGRKSTDSSEFFVIGSDLT